MKIKNVILVLVLFVAVVGLTGCRLGKCQSCQSFGILNKEVTVLGVKWEVCDDCAKMYDNAVEMGKNLIEGLQKN